MEELDSYGPSFLYLTYTTLLSFLRLSEGVQLLCLIDKAADACRYLQTYGEWNRAAWLAKVTQHDSVHQQETSDSYYVMFG